MIGGNFGYVKNFIRKLFGKPPLGRPRRKGLQGIKINSGRIKL
jgi:hypothetical protein